MIRLLFITLVFIFFCVNCGDTKKDPQKQTTTQNNQTQNVPKGDSVITEKADDLTDLVYEGTGFSLLKIESTARSQAELKGRKDVIKSMAEDAKKLINGFFTLQPGLFSDNPDIEAYGKAVEEFMNKGTTLKGCQTSEIKTSKDTTFAYMEMPLMNGYEVIENALAEVGKNKNFLKNDKIDTFKKLFHDYFLSEKKKMLTQPT
jgi:hypothetical protein